MPRQDFLFSLELNCIKTGSLWDPHTKSSSLYVILMILEDKYYLTPSTLTDYLWVRQPLFVQSAGC